VQEGAFLDSLQRQAQELDLRGWAQNTEAELWSRRYELGNQVG
jgi:hypothetical protein